MFMPIMFPEHVAHSQVKVEGAEPISAGFISFTPLGLPKVDMSRGSDSLKLDPHERDQNLIECTFLGMGTNSFVDWEN
jgi:hypothetical protein